MSQACAGATTLAQLLEENQILADKARSLEAKCHRLSVSSNSLQMARIWQMPVRAVFRVAMAKVLKQEASLRFRARPSALHRDLRRRGRGRGNLQATKSDNEAWPTTLTTQALT